MLTILFTGVIITGILVDITKKWTQKINKAIISLSVSIVLALLCVHIIPEIFNNNEQHLGYFILIGFVLQILLELMSKGIEHGHIHQHGTIEKKQLLIIFIGLSLHSLIEGIPITSFNHANEFHHHSHTNEENFSMIYFSSILIHKLPIAAVLMLFFKKISINKFLKIHY